MIVIILILTVVVGYVVVGVVSLAISGPGRLVVDDEQSVPELHFELSLGSMFLGFSRRAVSARADISTLVGVDPDPWSRPAGKRLLGIEVPGIVRLGTFSLDGAKSRWFLTRGRVAFEIVSEGQTVVLGIKEEEVQRLLPFARDAA